MNEYRKKYIDLKKQFEKTNGDSERGTGTDRR